MSRRATARRTAARRTTVKLTPLRRHLAAVVTIALSCAFVTVMVLAGSLVQSSLRSEASRTYAGADLEITRPLTDEDWSSEAPLPAPAVDGAEVVWPLVQQYLPLRAGGSEVFLQAAMLPPGRGGSAPLLDGSPAIDATGVVLDRAASRALSVGVGDTVEISSGAEGTAVPLTVTGIAAAPEGTVLGSTPRVLVQEVNAKTLLGPTAGTLAEAWLATVPEGTDPAQVAQAAAAGDLEVRTAEEAEQAAVDQLLRGFTGLGMMLGVFVVIALVTSAVVIANTFAVALAQRTRSLALLRTLGATRGQVRTVVLRESLLVGLLGAGAGMLTGHLLVQAALALAAAAGWLPSVLVVPVGLWSVLLPLVAGLALTLLASLAPLQAATRVAPLQALRPAPPAPEKRFGVRGALGLAAVVLGAAALVGGAVLAGRGQAGPAVLAAVLGGVLSFAGVLGVLVLVTRPLAALAARLVGRIGGLPAKVAGANITRTPRRSAATVAALLIGTTLMTMMTVGARTAESTLTSELDSRRPIDLVLSAEEMPADAAARIAAVDGMDTAVATARGDIQVGAGEPMTLYAVTPQQLTQVSHRPGMADLLADDVVLIGQERAERFGVHDGQVLQVHAANGTTRPLRVLVDANLQMSLVTPATLSALLGERTSTVVLGDFADPGSPERAGIGIADLVSSLDEVITADGFVGASATLGGAERESYAQVLDVLLGITVALLAVAVLVALVGVANTLSLGVVERTGENALLRTLGTTRRQMRWMLGWEGLLLALVGAVLGLVLGSIYGVLGIQALLGSVFPITITLPVGRLALVLAATLLAGVLASVLPGRAAARTAPVTALASAD
ncbi:FtsX-like permease family protein [Brachybacterium aquaticum]|uniref:Putative ABC transport system permease protein n=1 Tax=Brachybacterium aquaticum TaxID=1432564 RepID=A0A841AAI3_9MICO|nr:ABC transporter permease [Brachybacterium aquaticum]MBB5830957.1 putative ABC transport system permease protein [Brachybacterium aquaticum]